MNGNSVPWKLPWKPVEVDLLPWEIPWKLLEVDLLHRTSWTFPLLTSMELHGSFHSRWKWKLPLLASIIASSTNTILGSFHEIPYTPTYSHLLPRVSQTSSSFHKISIRVHRFIRVHRLPFDLPTRKTPPTFRETSNLLPCKFPWKSVEVNLLAWKFPCKLVEVDLLPWKLWKPPWKFMEFSTVGGSGSFH